jgi:uncharacterized repeat protein (TIGR01451 family)
MKMKHTIFHMKSGNQSGGNEFGAQKRTRSAFMRKDLLALGLGMVLSCVTVLSSSAAGGAVELRGHVPAAVSQAQAVPLGRVDSEKMMQISIGLSVRNPAALSNLLQQISDPSSPNFRHYLTQAQFADAFGATEKDYQAVIDFVEAHQLKVTQKHANRLVLSVRGKATDVEKAFNVTLGNYQHPRENRTFFAPDANPVVDAGLKILHVSGLDNYSIPRPGFQKREASQINPAQPAVGSGPQGTYQGNDFRKAYVPNTLLTGAGQNVALVQFDGFFASDITTYENQIGLTAPLPNIVVVPIDGGISVPTPAGNPETSLDIEMVLSMSPRVSNIYVYEAPNGSPWPDMLSRMADDNLARNLSSSWFAGQPDPTVDEIFQQMAVQGQSFFECSSDGDAFVGTVPFLCDNPYVTVVGGTTLTTTGNANYLSETVWNWSVSQGLDGQGSSGGISTVYPIPSYQTNINMAARGGSATMRNVPDVALTADNVLVKYGAGQTGIFGGTSCAAPLWAGFMALANQQATLNSQPPLGFINPAIYSIAQSGASYNSSFHDVTTGNNEWSLSPNKFVATFNYDLATGLGTPNGTNLINALLAVNKPAVHISPPPPPYGSTMASVNGGNPNGSWMMFIQDDAPVGSGMIANGWILNLTTADLVGMAGDVEVLTSSTNTTAFVGQTATFVVTVTNYGPSLSTNVVVTDDLPLGTTILSTNITQGTVTRLGSTLNWNVGNLALNAGASLTLTVKPSSTGVLANSATVNTGTPDPNPDDDSAFASVNFVPLTATLTPIFTNGAFHISIPGPTNPSLTVIVQANSNLVSTNWVNIYTGAPPIDFVDPAASSSVQRFYRAILLP